jgi:transposase InsO family protein
MMPSGILGSGRRRPRPGARPRARAVALDWGIFSQHFWGASTQPLHLRDLAAVRVRYGYRRLHVLLRREGWPVNHKRTYRLYAEEGLSIRTKLPRRKRAWRYRQGRPGAAAPNEIWAMDFMSDQLFDGRPIRILTVVDIHTREGLSSTRPVTAAYRDWAEPVFCSYGRFLERR